MASLHSTAGAFPEHNAPLYDARNFPGSDSDLVVELAVPVTKTDANGYKSAETSLTHLQLEIPHSDDDATEKFSEQTHPVTTNTSSSASKYSNTSKIREPLDSANQYSSKAYTVRGVSFVGNERRLC